MKTLYIILFLCTCFSGILAQENTPDSSKVEVEYNSYEEGKNYVIIRHNGVEYIGKILSYNNREILIKTQEMGEVYIPKYEIKSIIELKDNNTKTYTEYKAIGPFTTRYSFTTNALPIKKGENYGMVNLYGPEAHLAISDRLNAGIMTSWIASPIALAFKYSFTDGESKTNLSFGSMIGTSGYLNNFKGYGGLHWLNITYGNRKNNITLAGGYAYLQSGIKRLNNGTYYNVEDYEKLSEQNSSYINTIHGPILSIAGIYRIGPNSSLIFDSMIGLFGFEDYEENSNPSAVQPINGHAEDITVIRNPNAHATLLFLMPGIRFQKTENKAFQICLAGVSVFEDETTSFPLPMCSWFYRF